MHFPSAERTIWHVTFGTYGTRLHGGIRPTVDRRHNEFGEPFLDLVPTYEQIERDRLQHPPRLLSTEQRKHIQSMLPEICERGGWLLLAHATAVDHVHLLIEVDRQADGKTIRTLVKRWLSQVLQERFESRPWWAEGGSNKVVDNPRYLASVRAYVSRHSGA